MCKSIRLRDLQGSTQPSSLGQPHIKLNVSLNFQENKTPKWRREHSTCSGVPHPMVHLRPKRPNRAISASKARDTRALKKSTSMFIATFSVSIRPWNANWFFGCGYCQEIITTSGWRYQRTEIPNKNIHANGPSFGQIAHGNAWLSHATFTRRKNVESICSCRIAGPKIKTFQDFHVNCFVYVMIFRKSPNSPIGQLVWISSSSPCHLRVESAAMYDISHFWASACKKRTAVICACRPKRTAQLVTL